MVFLSILQQSAAANHGGFCFLKEWFAEHKTVACLLGSFLRELTVGLMEFLVKFSREPLRHGSHRANSLVKGRSTRRF